MTDEQITPDDLLCPDDDGVLVFDHWEQDGDYDERTDKHFHVDVAIYKCSKCGEFVHEDSAVNPEWD